MKPPLLSFATPLAILGLCLSIQAGQPLFEENFNFGVLDPNLTTHLGAGYSATIATNLYIPDPSNPGFSLPDEGGWLHISASSSASDEGKVTTSFESNGDFTANVTAYQQSFGSLGLRMLTADGYAAVYVGPPSSQPSAVIAFPSHSETNLGVSYPAGNLFRWGLRIVRTGNTLSLQYDDYSETPHQPASKTLLTATDSAFGGRAIFELYLRSSGGLGGSGLLDDFKIRADSFSPTPIPRLFTQIVPAAYLISWPSYSNRIYQVWYRDALTTNVWTPLGSTTAGTGYMVSMTNWAGGQSQRYYQVVEVPSP